MLISNRHPGALNSNDLGHLGPIRVFGWLSQEMSHSSLETCIQKEYVILSWGLLSPQKVQYTVLGPCLKAQGALQVDFQ